MPMIKLSDFDSQFIESIKDYNQTSPLSKTIIVVVLVAVVLAIAIIFGSKFIYPSVKAENAESAGLQALNDGEGLTDQQLKEKIGQMIIIGFRGVEASEKSDIYKIIKDVKIGGVSFSDFDVPSNSFPRNIVSPQQTKKLIFDLQKYSETPLLVAVDAEGGNINRLKKQYGFLSILSPKKMGQDKTLKTTEKESAGLAKELKELGFNMNLAPVVDVDINPKNSVIGALGRSFSSDPKKVVSHSEVFIKSHLKNDIITVEKHFPGQGSATKDSHLGITNITKTFKQKELLPYQKLNDQGLLNAVMAGHITNKNIDQNYPATLSAAFLQDILRKQIGFKGVIISDDMQMAAISDNYKFDEAIIMAVNAGCDIIYFFNNSPSGYDKDLAYKIRDVIFKAVKENKIEEKRIIESYNRILNLKKQFKIIPSETLQPPQTPQATNSATSTEKTAKIKSRNFELVGEINPITFEQALDIAKDVEEITKVRPAFLLGVLQEELTLEKFDLCYVTNFKTGEGIRVTDGKILPKTMKPDRDVAHFLTITKELGKDPLKTLVTCPMSFGWGGAMGPADFIPSTWVLYKDRLQNITGEPADPWNIRHAFLAAGLYLADSGAISKKSNGEWNAAMIYFSGSPLSKYTFYAKDVLAIAKKLQADIETIKKTNKKLL